MSVTTGKPLHERFYKAQIEDKKIDFEQRKELALDFLNDLVSEWSIMEADDYYIDELSDLKKKAEELFNTISEDLEEEISKAEEEGEDQPDDPEGELEDV